MYQDIKKVYAQLQRAGVKCRIYDHFGGFLVETAAGSLAQHDFSHGAGNGLIETKTGGKLDYIGLQPEKALELILQQI